jgi:hypothetical protein
MPETLTAAEISEFRAMKEEWPEIQAALRMGSERLSSYDGHLHDSREGARFWEVATANDLPTTRPVPQLYKVKGPPVLFYMVDPDGQREIGWSAHAAASADITLNAGHTPEANATDITGATVTLPKPGNYVINTVFDFTSVTGVASSAVGILREADDTVVDSPRGAIFNPGATGDRATVTQTYRFTTTTDDEVLKLSAYQTSAVNNAFTVNQVHTTIAAWGGLGGDTNSASHTHTHAQATSQTEDDHHLGFTGLEGDGSPVVPDSNNRINIIGGANVTVTPTANDITIASSGGAGTSHDLLSVTHPDTVPATPAKGDLIIAAAAAQWSNLPVGAQGNVLVSAGGAPGWSTLGVLAPGIDHGLLAGLVDDDHPQYANQTNTEVISGEWTWETYTQYAAVSAPSAPPEGHVRTYLVIDGVNLVLRGIGPTGATCDLCSWPNVAVAHTNTLALNWIE